MTNEGAFSNSQGSLIDEALNKDRLLSVITHETVHYELGSSTTYGQLLMMLHKNALFDARSNIIYGELFSHVNRLQERAAVNIELLSQYIKNDEKSYYEAIETLKERNRTYYNYFRKLCSINGKVKSREDAEEMSSIVLAISKLAMNVNLDDIPFENFHTQKDVQRFFSRGNNNSKYNPNCRFDIIVNFLFRSNNNHEDFNYVVLGTLPLEYFFELKVIHNNAVKAATKIFASSPMRDRLNRRIETIGVQEISIHHENANTLTILPVNLNNNQKEPRFVALKYEDFVHKLNEQEYREIIIPNQLGGFEDIFLCTIFDNKGEGIIYGLSVANEFALFEVLQKLNCTTIFTKTKIVSRTHKSLKRVIGKLPIYIHYDSPIVNALDFIKTFYRGGNYYFLEHNNHLLLIIYKRSFYSIFNIVTAAKDILEPFLNDQEVTLASNSDYKDEVIRINQKMQFLYHFY